MSTGEISTEMQLLGTLYQEGRQTLVQDLQGLDVEALDWRGIDPEGVVTVGSQIIHIAGFDNMVRSALLGEDLPKTVRQTDWLERFGSGFPRELGVDPPQGNPLDYYLDILHAETRQTLRVISCIGDAAIHMDGSTDFYEDGMEFRAAGLRSHSNRELSFYIPMHDRYHRGQITHQKYDYAVTRRRNLDSR
jgi:hypothetical protein